MMERRLCVDCRLKLQIMTHHWKDSMFNVEPKNTVPILVSSEPELLRKGFSNYNPHDMPIVYTLIPEAHQQSSWVVCLTQPIICRQPLGIGLTAWQTVILNTTHTGIERVLLLHCHLARVQPNNSHRKPDWKTYSCAPPAPETKTYTHDIFMENALKSKLINQISAVQLAAAQISWTDISLEMFVMWSLGKDHTENLSALYSSPTASTFEWDQCRWETGLKKKSRQKVNCLHCLKEGKGRGLKCAQLYGGTVIGWTQYIRDKSTAYLKVHLRDNRCKLHKGRNAQTRLVARWPA